MDYLVNLRDSVPVWAKILFIPAGLMTKNFFLSCSGTNADVPGYLFSDDFSLSDTFFYPVLKCCTHDGLDGQQLQDSCTIDINTCMALHRNGCCRNYCSSKA